MQRYVVEHIKTERTMKYFGSKKAVARYVSDFLLLRGDFTSITVTKQCGLEASSASDATRNSATDGESSSRRTG